MKLTTLDMLFWAAGLFGHSILLAILIVRNHVKTFPVFTTLTASHIAQTVILYLVHRSGTRDQYFWTYWSFQLFEIALQLAVLCEIGKMIFAPLRVWSRDVRLKLLVLVVISFAIAGGLAFMASPPTQRGIQVIYLKGNLFAAVLMSELFVVTTSLSARVGLAWKNHVQHLAQGLGIYSIATLIVETADIYFGLPAHSGNRIFLLMQHCRIGIYLCCLCYWIVTLCWPERPPRPVTPEMRAKLFQLQAQTAYIVTESRQGER